MEITLRIVLLVVSVFFLAFVLFRVRRGKYLLKYSLVWILLSILGVISSVWPGWIYHLAGVCGFTSPSNFVYFVLIALLLISNLVMCGVLSRQETMIKSIVQTVSILNATNENAPKGPEESD